MLLRGALGANACGTEGLLQCWAKGEVLLQCRPTDSLGGLLTALELDFSRAEMGWPRLGTIASVTDVGFPGRLW